MHEQRRVQTAWVAASEKAKFTGEVSGFMISWLRNISRHIIHTSITGCKYGKSLYTGPVHLYGVYRRDFSNPRNVRRHAKYLM